MEIEFVGDWDPDTVRAAVLGLRKALGMGAGEGAQTTLLSARQKRLIELLRKAGPGAEEEDADPPDWGEVYPLQKASSVGQLRVTPDGRVLRLNRNRRWERVRADGPRFWGGTKTQSGLEFPVSDGPYGPAIYLSVPDQVEVGDGLRLRLRLNVDPSAIVTSDQLDTLADDYGQDLELVLDGHGIRAVVEMDGPRIRRLAVRDPADLELLGSIGGEKVPQHLGIRVLQVKPGDDGLLLDVELVERELTKGLIHGCTLLPAESGRVERERVRAALDWVRARGGSLGGLPLRALVGIPDVAPDAAVVGWPSPPTLYLVPNPVETAQHRWLEKLAKRLEHGCAAGAVEPGQALAVLTAAIRLAPHEWLGLSLASAAGAVLLRPDERYTQVLLGRGLAHWGDEAAIADCLGEDLRTVWIPEIPNLVTLEWDLACPDYARMGQELASQLWQERFDETTQ